jgi:hypothetical protein
VKAGVDVCISKMESQGGSSENSIDFGEELMIFSTLSSKKGVSTINMIAMVDTIPYSKVSCSGCIEMIHPRANPKEVCSP